MNKIIYKSIILLACICCLQSCKKEEIMYYEGGSAVHFLSRTQNHSFLLTLDEQYGEMTIPVMLVGNPVDKDINLSYEIINDEQYTTASSEHYEILEAVINSNDERTIGRAAVLSRRRPCFLTRRQIVARWVLGYANAYQCAIRGKMAIYP
jgi:hypothetical protein